MTRISELLRRAKNLEIRAGNLVDGVESGAYRSRFRGGGLEFSEVRGYVTGDDARRIDWNVSARYNDLFVKEFVEENELDVYVVIDMSASNDFGSLKSKKELGFEIAASLMLSALKNNDRIGLALFTDSLERFIQAKKGKKHLMRVLKELVEYEPKNTRTDISNSLVALQKNLKQKSAVFVISDFISDSLLNPLKLLNLQHYLVLVNLYDTNEVKIPRLGYAYLEDAESGEQILVNTLDERFQNRYCDLAKKTRERTEYEMKKIGIDFISVSNEEAFNVTFNRYMRSRV